MTNDQTAFDAAPNTSASGAPYWADWRDRWPNAEASRFVRAAGLTWHVQIAGSGPPLLLLHGSGGGTHSWLDSLPRLAARYTVVACDLPGHAFTDAPPADRLSIDGMAGDIAALLTTLGVRPQLAVGHSAGAAVLLRMTLDGALPDVRGLVGINAAIVPPPDVAHIVGGSWLRSLVGELVTSTLVARLAAQFAAHTGAVETMLRSSGSQVPPRLVACYEALASSERHVRSTLTMMNNWALAPLIRDAAGLRVRTLLLAGANDRWVPPEAARAVAAGVPGVDFELWPGLGHLMHEEMPLDVADRVLAAGAGLDA